ncbi:hypothetical protein DFS34DRAFT_591878 [Phlyctochytrium arcticum]|nr:hypothetical protein DFS34DRAFT_591878 [Phlyctochytrium arcticum]
MSQVMGITPQSVGSCSELVATILGFLAAGIILRVDLDSYVTLRKVDRIWAREASRIIKKRLQDTQTVKALSIPDYIFDYPCSTRNPLLIDVLELRDICRWTKFLGISDDERDIFADLLWRYILKKRSAHRETDAMNFGFIGSDVNGSVAVRAKKVIETCTIWLSREEDEHRFFSVSVPNLENCVFEQKFELLKDVEIGTIGTTRNYPFALRLEKSSSPSHQAVGDRKKCGSFILAVNTAKDVTEGVVGEQYHEFMYSTAQNELRHFRPFRP